MQIDFKNMISPVEGADRITWAEVEALRARGEAIDADLRARRRQGDLPFYDLPYQDVTPVLAYAEQARRRFENFVVVGIGGSALGNIALQTALRHPCHNLLPRDRRGGPRMFFPDNIDPDMVGGLFDALDPRETLFNVITKSGSTAETMSAFLLVRQALIDAVGDRWREHVVATTDPEKGDLRQIAREEGLTAFDIPEKVGGRFSVLTPVGLLSAAVSGIDIRALLSGAAGMDARLKGVALDRNPAYVCAALLYLADVRKGRRIVVMMPYVQALRDVSDWFRQLWAESLGKRLSLTGEVVHVGQTPVKAIGATDQHSQMQLYVEGPHDKVVVFLAVERYGRTLTFPAAYEEKASLGYFAGRTMNELIQAERVATALALTQRQRPNLTVTLPEVTPQAIGQLLYLLEAQTLYAGGLYGVDPLDQPGVEAGKVATYALMGRKGYERQREEIAREIATDERYLL